MLATVASVNSANRLRTHLTNKYSISSRVIQTPSALTKEGCGYSVKFDDKYKQIVIKSASELRINVRAYFREEINNEDVKYIKE
ncbi:MAG: DUF3343 domain-containing protein [Clostridia bacterium]|nr:DUF3343 domain-containing protein [Clostridia bacterium]